MINPANLTTAEEKNNKLMSSEGMEATEEEIQEFDDEDAIMDPVDDSGIGFSTA